MRSHHTRSHRAARSPKAGRGSSLLRRIVGYYSRQGQAFRKEHGMGDMPGAIRSVLSLCATASFALIASPASPVLAGESGKINGLDYWGTRDALYERVNLIAELEA